LIGGREQPFCFEEILVFSPKSCFVMETRNLPVIIIIGAGKLAWHLAPALAAAGYPIKQVYSRSEISASALAEKIGVEWTTDAGALNPDADMLLFCIPDKAIKEFLCFIERKEELMMVHTAGSVPADVFAGIAKRYGVLYPLMTFSKERSVNLGNVPFCIEGSDPESLNVLENMAGCLSKQVHRMDSTERKRLHLAAIIAGNFSNHMYRLAKNYLSESGTDFDLLKPLILETALKVMEIDPAMAQTGPASRNDELVLREHAELLKEHPEWQKLYTFVSGSITNHFKAT
jgi:predicted short-subunit dehydrogenase-like oxidoreductase (DUF2520 family)